MENIQKTDTWTVAVVGSRSVAHSPALLARLDGLLAAREIGQVVSGGAVGVDRLAAQWARTNGVPLVELLPDYTVHGAGAPHVRNAAIVSRAGLVLVVWDGASRGTLSAARAAAKLGRRCEWLAAPAPGPRRYRAGWGSSRGGQRPAGAERGPAPAALATTTGAGGARSHRRS